MCCRTLCKQPVHPTLSWRVGVQIKLCNVSSKVSSLPPFPPSTFCTCHVSICFPSHQPPFFVPLLWLSMQNYLGLGSSHFCPCSAYKSKRMDGAVRVRSQNLKSVSAVSAAAPSLSKNIPNTASRGRGGQFLEEGPCVCPRLSMQLLRMDV